MPRESQAARSARALEVMRRLAREFPEARIALAHQSPLELLVAVVLSAQCTDARVNLVTPALFARYPTAGALARATPEELEPHLRTLGLYRNKAKHLVALGRALVERHGGTVPGSLEELQTLPGVGRKTAGVVAINLGTGHAFPVDTHVQRIALRLALTHARTPAQIEHDLMALLPRRWWKKGHHLFIWHGRKTCTARAPACERCVLLPLCPTGQRNEKARSRSGHGLSMQRSQKR